MAIESTIDTIRRLRLEASAILDALGGARDLSSVDRCGIATIAQRARLDGISAELRRIAVKAASPDAQRDAESLAAMIDNARSPQTTKYV